MIFPFLDGFLPFRKIPVTWILLLTNVFLFSQNAQLSRHCNDEFRTIYQNEKFLETQGRVYSQFLGKGSAKVQRIKSHSLLGQLALQDEAF